MAAGGSQVWVYRWADLFEDRITWVPVEVVFGRGIVWVSSVVKITSWVEHSASWGRGEGELITISCEVVDNFQMFEKD